MIEWICHECSPAACRNFYKQKFEISHILEKEKIFKVLAFWKRNFFQNFDTFLLTLREKKWN
jgi:hypothetical protein